MINCIYQFINWICVIDYFVIQVNKIRDKESTKKLIFSANTKKKILKNINKLF
jgi:hypothetical protein